MVMSFGSDLSFMEKICSNFRMTLSTLFNDMNMMLQVLQSFSFCRALELFNLLLPLT